MRATECAYESPVHHPFDPLLALRVSSLELPEEKRWQLIDRIFKAVWVNQRHVSEPQVIKQLAEEIGLNGEELVAAARVIRQNRSYTSRLNRLWLKGFLVFPVWYGSSNYFLVTMISRSCLWR